MTPKIQNPAGKSGTNGFSIGLDTWAVSLALLLGLLVGIGLLKHVPW